MKYLHRKYFAFAVLVGLIIFMIVLIGLWQSSRFRLIDSTPKLGGNIPTSTSTILLRFSEPLNDKINYMEKLSGESSTAVTTTKVKDKELFLTFKPLGKDQSYSLIITEVVARQGKVIKNIPVRFATQYVPYDQLDEEQQKLELQQTDRITYEDPLFEHLPHQGDRFYLTTEFSASESDETIMVINAQLFLSRSDLGGNRSAAIEKYKQQVENFIRSKDLDPAKYNIRYEINEPPATN